MATQVPSSLHIATLWTADPIPGMTQHARRNKERAKLNTKEIALLDLLRAPDVYVEAGWGTLVERVQDALAFKELREDALRDAVAGERNTSVRESFTKLFAGRKPREWGTSREPGGSRRPDDGNVPLSLRLSSAASSGETSH